MYMNVLGCRSECRDGEKIDRASTNDENTVVRVDYFDASIILAIF